MFNSELITLRADTISDSYLLRIENGGPKNLARFYWGFYLNSKPPVTHLLLSLLE